LVVACGKLDFCCLHTRSTPFSKFFQTLCRKRSKREMCGNRCN
jgi:hypothetical protein